MIPFKIDHHPADRGLVVATLSGRLNAVSAPEAKDGIKSLVREVSHNLVLDLAELSFIDSSGLAALVAGYKAAMEAGGNLKLASLAPQVAQVLALTHLDRVFEIYAKVDEALRSFPAQA
jgi:anti-anti-sigma factor